MEVKMNIFLVIETSSFIIEQFNPSKVEIASLVNTTAADVLACCVTRQSATMASSTQGQPILVYQIPMG